MSPNEVTADARPADCVTWDLLSVGDQLGPLHYELSEATAASFEEASTLSEEARRLLRGATRVAHPLNTLSDYTTLMLQRYGVPLGTGLHTRHQTTVHHPLPVGEPIETVGELVDLFERRGRDHWVMRYEARAHGQVLVTHTMTATVDRADQEQPTPAKPGGGAKPPTGDRDDWRDSPMWALPPRTFTRDMFIEFGRQYRLRFGDDGPPPPGAHTSVEVAHAIGLPDIVGYSGHYFCWFAELALVRFGAGWMNGGSVEARFLAPVFPGDTVSVHAAAADDGKAAAAVRAVNQDGRLVAVGRIRDSGSGDGETNDSGAQR